MNLITDRTLSDVWAGNEKGRYTHSDLNRVEETVQALCRQAESLDIRLNLQICTRWGSEKTWPTRQEMARFLDNIRCVTQKLWVSAELPESMEYLDYAGANRIELALEQAQQRIRGVLQTYQMSGELFAGEENGI